MIIAENEIYKQRAEEVSAFLGNSCAHLQDLLTLNIGSTISVSINSDKKPSPLFVDFVDGKLNHRINSGNKKELLIRALGIKPNEQHDVFDATAGLGKDSFIMASRGANVTMFEKNPLIFLLLEDGLVRANNDDKTVEISKNMSLINTDFLEYTPANKPYAVYLDPMFPERRKSALVKKDMQVFHLILHDTPITDENLMLQKALDIADKKVVVKRPIKAPNLAGRYPNHVVSGKTCRYDVYVAP